ncbi:MAG: hypothetical protein ILP16_09840 [Spirochaetales bacterium]|nr:hypothetical protein [Spirochaetales bacterium]
MRQLDIKERTLEKIRSMDDSTLITYIKDMYCMGYEDAKKDRGTEAVDFEGFSDALMSVSGIGFRKKNYILKTLRQFVKHYDENDKEV